MRLRRYKTYECVTCADRKEEKGESECHVISSHVNAIKAKLHVVISDTGELEQTWKHL